MDPVVLNFNDSLLRQSDLKILDGPNWLNDNLIAFYFEYLEKIVCAGNDNVAFLGPGITQLIKVMTAADEILSLTESLSLCRKQFIFLPVNDSLSQDSPGGSHWSLLVYNRLTNRFNHFDSCNGMNANHAKQIAGKLDGILSHNAEFAETGCRQQDNHYDCGLHVLNIAEMLIKFYLFGNPTQLYAKVDSTQMRTKLKQLIKSLA